MIYDKDPRRNDDDEILDDDLLIDSSQVSESPEDDIAEARSEYPDVHVSADDDDPDAGSDADPDSDMRPDTPPARGRQRDKIFKIGKVEDDDDFFDAEQEDEEPEEKPAPKVKTPKLDPEDPDYWIEDESPIGSLITKPRKAWMWWTAGIVTLLAMIAGAWIWFMRPYADSAVKYGYLKHMERRGSLVKTFEGVLIPYRELGDSTPTYFEEIRFSVCSDSIAARMKRMMLDCVPVRLEYELYHTPLPWKGAEAMIVVKVDSADTSKILPPEYR